MQHAAFYVHSSTNRLTILPKPIAEAYSGTSMIRYRTIGRTFIPRHSTPSEI
jgi:hypothetical protein